MAHDVLISYSSHDKLQADAICNRLESQGIRCWIAPRDVPLGSEYADSIVQAIESAQVMVLVYSTHADESHQVRREVERAVSNGITIIPVRIENAAMSEAFQYYVGSMHWLDAINPPFEQHIDKLAHDLNALLSKGGRKKAITAGDAGSEVPASTAAAASLAATGGAKMAGTASAAGTQRAEAASYAGGAPAAAASEPQGRGAGPAASGPAALPSGGSRRSFFLAGGIAVAVVVAAAGYYVFLGPQRTVTVPAVAGLLLPEAVGRIGKAGLRIEKIVYEEHAQLDYPKAIRTAPDAGQASPRNGEVTLHVSGTDVLPDLTDLSTAEARRKLGDLGFDAVQVKSTASTKAEGTVLGMEPTPGRRLFRGKPVTLVVAGAKVDVPDVLRMPLAQAEKLAAAAKLVVKVERDWNKDARIDTVFRTEPGSGTKASPGDTLTLYVAALGGWVYPEIRQPLVKDRTFRMPTARYLRASPNRGSQDLGAVPTGKTVKVLEAYGDGWAKVVVID